MFDHSLTTSFPFSYHIGIIDFKEVYENIVVASERAIIDIRVIISRVIEFNKWKRIEETIKEWKIEIIRARNGLASSSSSARFTVIGEVLSKYKFGYR